jgi:drug/metabolite transporter (DMT)-like permease
VRRIGVTIASIYSNLVPIVVVLIAMLEGIQPTTGHLIGGLLIISGVLIAQLWPVVSKRLRFVA